MSSHDIRIVVDDEPPSEDVTALEQGVRVFNEAELGPGGSRHLTVFARDESDALVGGVAGRTIYDWFLIHVVWIAEPQRGQGLGRRLMQRAEDVARERGCAGAQVDTLSFQAPGFYQRLGFEIIGHVPDFPAGHSRYFLARRYDGKSLRDAGSPAPP